MHGFLGDRGTKREEKRPHHNMLSSLSRARGLGPLLAPPARGVAGKVVASKRRPLPHKAVMELVPTAPPPTRLPVLSALCQNEQGVLTPSATGLSAVP